MRINDLYSTPIAVVDDVYVDPSTIAQRAQKLVEHKNSRPSDWYCTTNTTIHYDNRVDRDNTIKPLADSVQTHLNTYSQQIWKEDCQIIHCWANVSKSNDGQERHNHITRSTVHISAVYYPQVEDSNQSEKLIFAPPFALYDIISTEREMVRVKTNRLIIFPAYLEHYFVPIHRNINKISIAFNAIVK
jgi:hypothetical protein